jgi:hypothetical protein
VRGRLHLVSGCGCRELRGRGEDGHCLTGHGHHQSWGRRSDGEGPERLPLAGTMFEHARQEQRKWLWERQVHDWVSVDSSVFASVAYRGDERQLFLRFHSGKVYRYFGFPPDQYDELLAAESKGGYFAESIRGKFIYEEVREAHGSAG